MGGVVQCGQNAGRRRQALSDAAASGRPGGAVAHLPALHSFLEFIYDLT